MTLRNIIESNGIFVSEEDYNEELVIDSIQFVSIIVAIESEFNISVSENNLSGENLKTFNDFIKLIKNAKQNL